MRMETIQEDHINLDLPMYLDGQGVLQVAVPVYVMADGGLYEHILSPMTEHARADRELSFDQAVSVTYRDGRMTVRIEENDWTVSAFASGNLEFGKEYEVHGVYKDYIDAAMLTIMNGEYAVPVFVSEDGMVSYLDLYSCAEAGYFCITEPVCGLTRVEAVTESNVYEVASALEQIIFEQSPDFPEWLWVFMREKALALKRHFIPTEKHNIRIIIIWGLIWSMRVLFVSGL